MKLNLFKILIAATFTLSICSCTRNKDSLPPNIIYIMSDDHAYQAISAYGYGLNETPNIDRLAKEGAIFTRACVTNSICAPSRAVMLTGKHSFINGKVDNRNPFNWDQISNICHLKEVFVQSGVTQCFLKQRLVGPGRT